MPPFVQLVALILVTVQPFISAAPTNGSSNEVDCENDAYSSLYDQRQNGTENVRVNVKDVFLVWAPEGQLASPGLLDSDFLDYPNEEVPQRPVGTSEVEKPTSIIDILNSFQELAATSSQRPIVDGNPSELPTSNSTELSINGTSPPVEKGLNLTSSKVKRSSYRLLGFILPLFGKRYRAA